MAEKCSAERPCGGCGRCVWHAASRAYDDMMATSPPTFEDCQQAAREVIDAALRHAREEGAAEMRERAATMTDSFNYFLNSRSGTSSEHKAKASRVWTSPIADAIRALPLTPEPDREETKR